MSFVVHCKRKILIFVKFISKEFPVCTRIYCKLCWMILEIIHRHWASLRITSNSVYSFPNFLLSNLACLDHNIILETLTCSFYIIIKAKASHINCIGIRQIRSTSFKNLMTYSTEQVVFFAQLNYCPVLITGANLISSNFLVCPSSRKETNTCSNS